MIVVVCTENVFLHIADLVVETRMSCACTSGVVQSDKGMQSTR